MDDAQLWPAGQGVHVDEPSKEKEPREQLLHAVAPEDA
jgi:hypothetical protein